MDATQKEVTRYRYQLLCFSRFLNRQANSNEDYIRKLIKGDGLSNVEQAMKHMIDVMEDE